MPGIELRGRSKIATYRHGGRIGLSDGTAPKVSKSKMKYKNGNDPKKSSYLGSGKKYIIPGKKWHQMDRTDEAKGGRVGAKAGGDGKWMQKVSASIKKRGTEGKCTPITKPGCTGKAKALAKTFKKIAARRKAA